MKIWELLPVSTSATLFLHLPPSCLLSCSNTFTEDVHLKKLSVSQSQKQNVNVQFEVGLSNFRPNTCHSVGLNNSMP